MSSDAQQQWQRAGKIARRAGSDDYTSDDNPTVSPEDKEARRQARSAQKEERMKTARTMDLPYFLEMVDLRTLCHRDVVGKRRADQTLLQTIATAPICASTTQNGKEDLPTRISFIGSIMEKGRTSAYRIVPVRNWTA